MFERRLQAKVVAIGVRLGRLLRNSSKKPLIF